jgi:hypothetical protein
MKVEPSAGDQVPGSPQPEEEDDGSDEVQILEGAPTIKDEGPLSTVPCWMRPKIPRGPGPDAHFGSRFRKQFKLDRLKAPVQVLHRRIVRRHRLGHWMAR